MRALMGAVGWLRRPLEAIGVDYPRFAAILQTKLHLDTLRSSRDSGGAETIVATGRGGLVVGCILQLVMGLVVGIFAVLTDDPLTFMTVTQGFTLLMVVMILLGDFASVLLDTTDLAIVGSRPVSERTLFAARLAHVVLYVGLLTGSTTVGPLLFGTTKFGAVFFPVYLVSSGLTACVAVSGAVLVHLVGLRYFRAEKVKDFVVFFQILATVALAAAYQFMPRLREAGEGLGLGGGDPPLFVYLFPPSHTGGLLDLCLGHTTRTNWVLSLLAFLVPAALLGIVVRLSSAGLLRGLSALDTQPAERPRKGRYRRWCRDRLTRTRTESCGFDFYALLTKRERQYKLRTYPMLAFLLVVSLGAALRLQSSYLFAGTIYYVTLGFPTALLSARFSETPRAAWIFQALPFDARAFLVGARKAYLAGMVVPLLALLSIGAVLIAGIESLPHVLFASLAGLAIVAEYTIRLGAFVPFVREFKPAETTHGCGTTAILVVVTAFAAGVHVALANLGLLAVLLGCLVIVAVLAVQYGRLRTVDLRSRALRRFAVPDAP